MTSVFEMRSLLEADKYKNTFSPVLGHGSCGGVQAFLSVQLNAAIYEGSAHTDLSLQLCQLVLHSLWSKIRCNVFIHLKNNLDSS